MLAHTAVETIIRRKNLSLLANWITFHKTDITSSSSCVRLLAVEPTWDTNFETSALVSGGKRRIDTWLKAFYAIDFATSLKMVHVLIRIISVDALGL